MTDIVARIDAALRPVCAWCHNTIPATSPSHDFCGEDCQHNWARHQAGDNTPAGPVFGGMLRLSEPTHRTEQDRHVDVLLRGTFTSESWARGWWTRCDPPIVLVTSNRAHVYIEARSLILDQSCVRILDGADAIIRIVPNELLARPGSIEDMVATFIREKTSRTGAPVTLDSVRDMCSRIREMQLPDPSTWRFTRDQWAQLRPTIPTVRPDTPLDPAATLFGIRIELVERVEDSTPYQLSRSAR